MSVTERLRRLADSVEAVTGPGGEVTLMRQAADRVEYLERRVDDLEDELAASVPIEQA